MGDSILSRKCLLDGSWQHRWGTFKVHHDPNDTAAKKQGSQLTLGSSRVALLFRPATARHQRETGTSHANPLIAINHRRMTPDLHISALLIEYTDVTAIAALDLSFSRPQPPFATALLHGLDHTHAELRHA